MLHSFLLPLIVAVGLAAPAAPQPKNEDVEACLACHGDKSMSVTLPSGETRSLYVDRDVVRAVGARRQAGLHRLPHRHHRGAARGEAVQDAARVHDRLLRACKRCHFANYSKTLDSVHYPAHRARRPDGAGVRRLPRRARHHAAEPAAVAHLADLRRVPRRACRRPTRRACTAARSSRRRTPTCPTCTDCHHVARHRRPARAGLAAEEPGAVRQLPHATRR